MKFVIHTGSNTNLTPGSHYISTEVSPLERHLYMLNISKADDITKHCITCFEDEELHGYYSASFSPKAGYYVLNYEGPEVPTTVVKKVGDSNFSKVLESNTALAELLQQYNLPKSRMVTVKSGGIGRSWCVQFCIKRLLLVAKLYLDH
jgi:dipeptidyl aminopeptidase B